MIGYYDLSESWHEVTEPYWGQTDEAVSVFGLSVGLPESKKPSVEEELDDEETHNFENNLDDIDDLDDLKDDHKDDVDDEDDHKDDDDLDDDHDDDDLEDDDDEGVRKRKTIEEKGNILNSKYTKCMISLLSCKFGYIMTTYSPTEQHF